MTTRSDPLGGVRLKMARAQHHFDAVQAEITAYIEAEPYEVVAEHNAETDEYIGRVKLHREPAPQWGITLAESAYQLRSALDLLVYQLAGLGPNGPGRKTAFPIFYDSVAYARDRNKYLNGVPDEDRAIIDSLQPYHRGDDAETDPLARLEWLTNEDKHRLVVPSIVQRGQAAVFFEPYVTDEAAADIAAGRRPLIDVAEVVLDSTGNVCDGAEIGRVRGIQGEVKMTFRLTTQIVFGSRAITLPQFAEIGRHVESILARFVNAFP